MDHMQLMLKDRKKSLDSPLNSKHSNTGRRNSFDSAYMQVKNLYPVQKMERERSLGYIWDECEPVYADETNSASDIQRQKDKPDSIFDFEKLKIFLKDLIQENQDNERTDVWKGVLLDEDELENYTAKVQTLLEDILQVDLQFLGVTNASYEEEGLSRPEEQQDGESLQDKYKRLILQKIAYLRMIRKKVQGDSDCVSKYIRNIDRQIAILNNIMENGDSNGFVFNLDVLQQGLGLDNDDADAYMVVVAPSTGTFKDISVSDDSQLTAYSKMLQMGINSPIRAFSWYTKYLMICGNADTANNTPLIRHLSITPEVFRKIHQTMVSEQKMGGIGNNPMNEDFKVANQFGIPVDSEVIRSMLSMDGAAGRLHTIGERSGIPEQFLESAGEFVELDAFKEQIGFGRKKGGAFAPTDVHFLDSESTAFHHIRTDRNGKVGIDLYTPGQLREKFGQINELMNGLILRLGVKKTVEGLPYYGLMNAIDDAKLKEWLKTLLEANHCLPPGGIYDLKGNEIERLEAEKAFASETFSSMSDDQIKLLIDTTLWRLCSRGIVDPAYGGENLKYKQREKLLSKVNSNSGFLFEREGLGIILNENFEHIKSFFQTMEQEAQRDHTARLRVVAFCFKLLRLIKEDANAPSDKQEQPLDAALQKRLFSTRKKGDFFDALNRHEGGQIRIGDEEVRIPFDRMTSTGRFVPEGGKPKYSWIPFVGGASGTTRDISLDLMNHGELDNERDYWNFQLLNASFMIAYSYHSFVEVMFMAAVTRKNCKGDEPISSGIMDYLKKLSDGREEPPSQTEIIKAIKDIIMKPQEVVASKPASDA